MYGNSWSNPWHYRQPDPDVYMPPQPYGHPPWDPRLGYTHPGFRSAQPLNPLLATDNTHYPIDIKKQPQPDIAGSIHFVQPALANGATSLRLISKAFPWSIDITSPMPITCAAVWDALYKALQEDIKDSEWGLIIGDGKHQKATEKAFKKRTEGTDGNKRMKRIDYLGDATMFKGLHRDEEFEKLRLLFGEKKHQETWVVKFGAS